MPDGHQRHREPAASGEPLGRGRGERRVEGADGEADHERRRSRRAATAPAPGSTAPAPGPAAARRATATPRVPMRSESEPQKNEPSPMAIQLSSATEEMAPRLQPMRVGHRLEEDAEREQRAHADADDESRRRPPRPSRRRVDADPCAEITIACSRMWPLFWPAVAFVVGSLDRAAVPRGADCGRLRRLARRRHGVERVPGAASGCPRSCGASSSASSWRSTWSSCRGGWPCQLRTILEAAIIMSVTVTVAGVLELAGGGGQRAARARRRRDRPRSAPRSAASCSSSGCWCCWTRSACRSRRCSPRSAWAVSPSRSRCRTRSPTSSPACTCWPTSRSGSATT